MIHVIPVDDLREHTTDKSCWCAPREHVDLPVWVHNSMDRREQYESGELKPA